MRPESVVAFSAILCNNYFSWNIIITCKIWGFRGGDYEEWRLRGCYAMWLLKEPTFRTNFAKKFLRSVRRLLVTASVVPSSPILVTLMKEALSSSETSVLTRATRRNIPEDAILHNSSAYHNKYTLITFENDGQLLTHINLSEKMEAQLSMKHNLKTLM
jgi:hypothetical protein